jgi:hypothetical protein
MLGTAWEPPEILRTRSRMSFLTTRGRLACHCCAVMVWLLLARVIQGLDGRHTYDELLYIQKHYISIEALRQANRAVRNRIVQY